MESLIPLLMAGAGFLVIGFILGHNKGFADGFNYAVANSEEVGKVISKEVIKNARMRVMKVVDGELKEVDGTVEEKPETVEETVE